MNGSLQPAIMSLDLGFGELSISGPDIDQKSNHETWTTSSHRKPESLPAAVWSGEAGDNGAWVPQRGSERGLDLLTGWTMAPASSLGPSQL